MHAGIAQVFNPTAELEMSTGTPIIEANGETETKLLPSEMKTRKYLR